MRDVFPRPGHKGAGSESRQSYNRSASPNPYAAGSVRGAPQQNTQQLGSDYQRHNSTGDLGRSVSPSPFAGTRHSGGEMSLQLAPAPEDLYGSSRSRHGTGRPTTSSGRQMSQYGGHSGRPASQQQVAIPTRTRSKSLADGRQFNREGRPIMHFARAQYNYTAAIPEELSFAKGDTLAVLRLQDDGWWEAEIAGKGGRPGLVPSNYLTTM